MHDQNPYAPPTQFSEPATEARKPSSFLGAILINLGLIVSTGFAWADIESILVSGSLMNLIALAMLIVTLWRRDWAWAAVAISLPLFSLLCFAIINFGRLSPARAQLPISVLITAYTVAIVFVSIGISIIRRERRVVESAG